MVLFKKKEDKWTIEEQYSKRDSIIMTTANYNEEYAKNLPLETYDRLAVYLQKDIVKLEDFDNKIFIKRLKDSLKSLEKAQDKPEESKKDDEVSPEQVKKEEDEKIIDFVERTSREEKKSQNDKKSDEKESKEENKQEVDNNDSKDDMNKTLKEYLLSEKSLDSMVKGIREKYVNIFDKSRDDIMDLYKTICNCKLGEEILDEYSKSIENCIDSLSKATEDSIAKCVKSNKHLKGRIEEIVTTMNISKNSEAENKAQVLLDSIIAIFISNMVSLRIHQIANEYKTKNDDELVVAIKSKLIELKNEMETVPDVARTKLMFFIDDLNSFIKDINDDRNNNSYSSESPFIPKDDNQNKEAVNFKKEWKKEGIHFDFDKMIIDLSSKPKTVENTTKKNAKDIKMILDILSGIINKDQYNYTLDSLENGTFELGLTRITDNKEYKFIIDTGAVLGHGNFIHADNHYISMKEKDILMKLFSDPDNFKLDSEEMRTIQSYLFRNPRLYQYIDMTGSKAAEKIKHLSDEDYIKLGDILTDIFEVMIYAKFNTRYRFRFKSFTSIDNFVLASDRYVKNIFGTEVDMPPVETTITYKDNKLVMNYGGEQSSQAFSFNS